MSELLKALVYPPPEIVSNLPAFSCRTSFYEPTLRSHNHHQAAQSLEQCLVEYPKRGIGGITIWRQALEGRDLACRETADCGRGA